MINFIKTLFFACKKKYGYLSQEFNDSQVQALSKNIPNKQGNTPMPNVSKYEANKYIFPTYEAFEKACHAFIKEKEAEERANKTKKSVRRPRKTTSKNKR